MHLLHSQDLAWQIAQTRQTANQCASVQCGTVEGQPEVLWVRRFDGDGMLHAVRIKAGKASYSNAYVQTSLLKQEKKSGKPLKLQACSYHTLAISCTLHMRILPCLPG